MRVAIVGAGLMGRWHADAANRAGGTIVAVVDADPARARALARRWPRGRPTTHAELAAAGARGGVDVVHVCSPLDTHAGVARQALALGAHLIVEKPLAPTATHTAELLDAARAAERMIIPVHQFAFQRGVRRVLLRSATLGHLRHMESVVCSAGADSREPGASDQVAADILPHPLSLAQLWLGPTLRDVQWQVESPLPGEWRVGGRRGDLSLGFLISMSGRPTSNTLRLIGDRGTAHIDLFHDFAVLESGGVSRANKITHPFRLAAAALAAASINLTQRIARRELAYPGLRALVQATYDAIRSSSAPPIGSDAIIDLACARDMIVEKIRASRANDAKPRQHRG